MSENNVIFSAEHIKKYFGTTRANDDVHITLRGGEIRGLIGENGSGKSTLISVIAGIHRKNSGEMYICGKAYEPDSPTDAQTHKIGTVVQELGLVDSLPVGVNIFLGRTEEFRKAGFLKIGEMYRKAAKYFEQWGFTGFSMQAITGTLSVEEKKIVELIRALSIDPDLLILDEITQALSYNYRKQLIGVINQVKEQGKAILLVTHDIEELVEITDTITILRDGKVVDTVSSADVNPDDVKRLMVGREISGSMYRSDNRESYDSEVVLSVKNIGNEFFRNVSFDLHKGEILGFCGLSDAGIHELSESLFAVCPVTKGEILLSDGTRIKHPWTAMNHKMGYVPKDRDKQALMIFDDIRDNICLPAVEMTKGKLGFLSPKKRDEISRRVVDEFEVKTTGITQVIRGLSGGNRQKVNLGRWMIQDKDILILDCPTRGVDVGVKSYIYRTMMEAKKKGISIILVSDELPELIGMADTIMVMKAGEIKKLIRRGEGFREESIIEVML